MRSGRTETTRLHRVVRPALSGLTVGAVAPPAALFAAALAAGPAVAVRVGVAAAAGVALHAAFRAAYVDDGALRSGDDPIRDAALGGGGAFVAGALPVAPFVHPDTTVAFVGALLLVAAVLGAVTWLRVRYADADALEAAVRVALGGAVAVAVGAVVGGL
ncbi:VIT1/CCC1 transporter family protein [Halobaculum sp. D14]|uniref:VIT1/CCC1 transporter family protein n=1 Tax=unclassified Halobaculum TaxID=2640896 RepID=UPI003EBCC734